MKIIHLHRHWHRLKSWHWFGIHRRKPIDLLIRYRHLVTLLVSVYVILQLTQMAWFQNLLELFHRLGYLGILIGGMLFVSSFTVTTGLIILAKMAEFYPLWHIAIVAGIGAALADLTLFEIVRTGLADEIRDLLRWLDRKNYLLRIIHHQKMPIWVVPVCGAAIIASPLPDELGVSLLGLSTMPVYQFVLITFALNALGILSLVVLFA